MTETRQERVADLVRAEFPHRTLSMLVALNFSIIILVAVCWYGFDRWQREQDRRVYDHSEVQDQWNINFRGNLEGLRTEIELSPRITAIETAQARQTEVLDAIAEKLGIE